MRWAQLTARQRTDLRMWELVMDGKPLNLVGVGVYTVAEAAALTGTSSQAIRRWVEGYRYKYRDEVRSSAPVWQRDIPKIEGRVALSFLDMMEIRFVRAFRQHHVSWRAIREAAVIACEMFKDQHPFTNGRFRTDGRRIFKQIEDEDKVRMFDLNRRHWVFNDIVAPSLYSDVQFDEDQIACWYPLYPSKAIIIDPRIAFGRAVTASGYVPTDTLAAATKANDGAVTVAAKWYGVPVRAVKAALEFERRYFQPQSKASIAA